MAIDRPELKATVLHSQKAEEGAWSLLQRLESKDLRMDLRVNGYKPVTAAIDEKDLASYSKFIKSLAGHRVLKAMSGWDQEEAYPEFLQEEDR